MGSEMINTISVLYTSPDSVPESPACRKSNPERTDKVGWATDQTTLAES